MFLMRHIPNSVDFYQVSTDNWPSLKQCQCVVTDLSPESSFQTEFIGDKINYYYYYYLFYSNPRIAHVAYRTLSVLDP